MAEHESILYSLFSTLQFPKEAYLHKRITKKMFLETVSLGSGDKKLFRENVKNVYWEYTLKPSTCPVLPFKDNEREYLEVAILEIELASQKGHKRIAEIIHRVIPYPLMLGFYDGTDEFSLSIAPKRFSQAEQGAFVVERFFTTGWMSNDRLNEWEAAFVASLAWTSMPLQNYGILYNAWVDRFTGYECSVLSGTFAIGKAGDQFKHLARCREIESRTSELRGLLKKEAFNRQVELNTEIKKLEQELKQLAASL